MAALDQDRSWAVMRCLVLSHAEQLASRETSHDLIIGGGSSTVSNGDKSRGRREPGCPRITAHQTADQRRFLHFPRAKWNRSRAPSAAGALGWTGLRLGQRPAAGITVEISQHADLGGVVAHLVEHRG